MKVLAWLYSNQIKQIALDSLSIIMESPVSVIHYEICNIVICIHTHTDVEVKNFHVFLGSIVFHREIAPEQR